MNIAGGIAKLKRAHTHRLVGPMTLKWDCEVGFHQETTQRKIKGSVHKMNSSRSLLTFWLELRKDNSPPDWSADSPNPTGSSWLSPHPASVFPSLANSIWERLPQF